MPHECRRIKRMSAMQQLEASGSWLLLCRVSKNLTFFLGKTALSNAPTSQGLPKIWGPFFLEKTALSNVVRSWGPFFWDKNNLEQRTHKLGASRNIGALFSGKETALSNVPTSQGLPKIWGPLFSKKNLSNVPISQRLPKIWGP